MCKKAVIWYCPDAWRCLVLELAGDKRLSQLRSMEEHREIVLSGNIFSLDNPEELLRLGVAIQNCRLSVPDELVKAINDIYCLAPR